MRSRQSGIGFDGYQDCAGAGFLDQQVCIQLMKLDYFGHGTVVTNLSCNAWTSWPTRTSGDGRVVLLRATATATTHG
jgi:hypothetical protein